MGYTKLKLLLRACLLLAVSVQAAPVLFYWQSEQSSLIKREVMIFPEEVSPSMEEYFKYYDEVEEYCVEQEQDVDVEFEADYQECFFE